MNISYNWLKNYIEINEPIEKLSHILTQIGLEVGGIEDFDSVKGGLEGFVTGEVLTCEKHPNADKLSVTTVNVGQENVLDIVCGAPNVAKGQKVVVATVGTTLYSDEGSFKIKKAKIRGEVSEGMICAEDEMGIGTSHDGIMVLPEDTAIGILASEYFKIEKDIVIEIDLTPNRVDASSHIGVARDLAAYFRRDYKLPEYELKSKPTGSYNVEIEVENSEACPRYMGICIDNIKVCESPDWLKTRLKAIGLNPINNIVDITNFVLHETGQPLHAFDGDKITGDKVIVKTLPENTKFITLDEEERTLKATDLMICNSEGAMCIGGVFGGIDSGITENTKKLFIESAYFNPVWVRKTAKSHGLSTDASFRFERGADVNMAPIALQRAAYLIQELEYGEVSSEIIDIYPTKIELNRVEFSFNNCNRLIGKDIGKETILEILSALEIKTISEDGDKLLLEIPAYRVDVYREADIIEDILRIYGFNNIENPSKISMSINAIEKPNKEKIVNSISDLLANSGFNEIMCNSLISANYFENIDEDKTLVKIHNPLSNDLSVMRPALIYGGLESIAYNIKRKSHDIKFFEFGRAYAADANISDASNIKRYKETKFLSIWISGKKNELSWNAKNESSDYYHLKAYVKNIFTKLAVEMQDIPFEIVQNSQFEISKTFEHDNSSLLNLGIVSKDLLKKFDIEQDVYYAEINWDLMLNILKGKKVNYKPVSKFPIVKRDLALLIDKNVTYNELNEIAKKTVGSLLKSVNLFDVYEGKNIEQGKVSYALTFLLEDPNKTMTDKQIDKIMSKLIKEYETKLNAKIR